MVGDGLVGDFQCTASLDGGLFQEERRQAPVQALPHDLFHQPHHIRKAGGHQLIGIICRRCGFFQDAFVHLGGHHPEFRVLFRRDRHVELDGAQHAGGREQAHIQFEQAVERDLAAFVRQDVDPKLPGFDQEQAGTIHASVVDDGPLFDAVAYQAAKDAGLLFCVQLIPYGKAALKFHVIPFLSNLCPHCSTDVWKNHPPWPDIKYFSGIYTTNRNIP